MRGQHEEYVEEEVSEKTCKEEEEDDEEDEWHPFFQNPPSTE